MLVIWSATIFFIHLFGYNLSLIIGTFKQVILVISTLLDKYANVGIKAALVNFIILNISIFIDFI